MIYAKMGKRKIAGTFVEWDEEYEDLAQMWHEFGFKKSTANLLSCSHFFGPIDLITIETDKISARFIPHFEVDLRLRLSEALREAVPEIKRVLKKHSLPTDISFRLKNKILTDAGFDADKDWYRGCWNCKFWFPPDLNDKKGLCHRYPPHPELGFPETRQKDKCGEWGEHKINFITDFGENCFRNIE